MTPDGIELGGISDIPTARPSLNRHKSWVTRNDAIDIDDLRTERNLTGNLKKTILEWIGYIVFLSSVASCVVIYVGTTSARFASRNDQTSNLARWFSITFIARVTNSEFITNNKL